jgi:hypothetical protein
MLDAKGIAELQAAREKASAATGHAARLLSIAMWKLIAPHLPELLARAAAWERVQVLRNCKSNTPTKTALVGMVAICDRFDRQAAKGFKP